MSTGGREVRGRRLPNVSWPDVLPGVEEFKDGDYWFCHGHPGQKNAGTDGRWFLYFHGAAAIPNHYVVEHRSGAISVPRPGQMGAPPGVANSVQIRHGNQHWHGYIEHGLWVELA